MLRRLTITSLVLLAGLAGPARGAWVRTTDFALTTAHTLERGEVQVGLLGPLLYGVSGHVQVGLHPVLLVVGAPNLSVRWRFWGAGRWEAAADASTMWSLLGREDASGGEAAATCASCGFPGRVRVTTTLSWSVTPTWVLSLGAGAGLNFLDLRPSGVVARLQGSVHWLVAPDNLISLDVSGEVPITAAVARDAPAAQLLYAHAFGTARVGVGVAVGEFELLRTLDQRERWWVYPVADVWWRF